METPTHSMILSLEERAVVLEQTELPENVATRLRFAVHQAAGVEVRLSERHFRALVNGLLQALDRTQEPAAIITLASVLDRIVPDEEAEHPEQSHDASYPSDLPPELEAEIQAVLRDGSFTSLDDAYEAIQEVMKQYNDTPMDAFQGLTPEQAFALVHEGWDVPGAPLQLNRDLTPESLADSAFYNNALVFLRALDEEEGIRLTPRNNLNRKFVQRMLEEMTWPRFELTAGAKTITEERFLPCHVLRILLELGEMAQAVDRKLRITELGRSCLLDENAGRLQAGLLTAMVQEFNLSYLDRTEEYHGVQETYPFILYALGRVAQEPVSEEVIVRSIFLADVAMEFLESGSPEDECFVFGTRVFEPMMLFGLLRETGPEADSEAGPRYQVTPLFNRMIRWEFAGQAT